MSRKRKFDTLDPQFIKGTSFWRTPQHLAVLSEIESSIKQITPKTKHTTKKLAFVMVYSEIEGKFTQKICFVCFKTGKCYLPDSKLNTTNVEIEDYHFVRWVTYKDL